jgi:hypothetical protein
MAYPQSIKEEARRLRLKGFSLGEIVRKLDISKSTASTWLNTVILNTAAKNRLLKRTKLDQIKFAEMTRNQTKARETLYLQNARNELKDRPDYKKIMCALLYWCEGNKDPRSMIFTNSDPRLVRAFLNLLKQSFVLDKSRLHPCIHIHRYHSASRQLDFWSKVTNINKQQFVRPYIKPNTGKRKREGYQGCLSLRYHDSDLARRLLAMGKASLEYLGV